MRSVLSPLHGSRPTALDVSPGLGRKAPNSATFAPCPIGWRGPDTHNEDRQLERAPMGAHLNCRELNYFSSTLAPAPSSLALMSSASALVAPSLIALGAP